MVVEGIAAIIVGGLVLIAFLIFFLVRCFCCCRGNNCCAKPSERDPAKRWHVWGSRIITAALLLVALAGGATMMAKSEPFSDELDSLTDTLMGGAEAFVANVTTTIDTIETNLPPNSTIDLSALLRARDDAQETLRQVQDADDDIGMYINGIRLAVFTVGAFTIAVVAVGLLGLLMRVTPTYIVYFVLAFLVCDALWLLGGIAFIAREVTDSSCAAMRLELNGTSNAWLDQNLECTVPSDVSEAITEAANAANAIVSQTNDAIEQINQGSRDAWDTLNTLCQPGVSAVVQRCAEHDPNTPPPEMPLLCQAYVETADGGWSRNENCGDRVPITPEDIRASYDQFRCERDVSKEDPQNDPNLQECVLDKKPLPANYYEELLQSAVRVDNIAGVLPTIYSIFQCDFLTVVFADIVATNCGGLQDTAVDLAGAALVAAAALTLASFCFCVCMSCLRQKKHHKEEPYGVEPSSKSAAVRVPSEPSGETSHTQTLGAVYL